MSRTSAAITAGLTLLAAPAALGQTGCSDPANAERPECLALPAPEVTNLVPVIGGAASLLGLAALAAGGASTASTAGTTGTTGTTGGN